MRRLIPLPFIILALAAAEAKVIPIPQPNPRQVHQDEPVADEPAGEDEADQAEPGADENEDQENPDQSDTAADEAEPDTPEEIPLPVKRPDVEEEEAKTPEEGEATTEDTKAGEDADEEESEEAEVIDDPAPLPVSEAELADCEAQLTKLGATFERLEPIDGEGLCGVSPPYKLITAAPGVTVTPDTEMSCRAALATAKWVNRAAIPAAEELGENVKLTGITHASTYVCRNRNSQSATKLSEHAKGNAIDVARFDFEGRDPVPIVPRAGKGSIEEAFQVAVRKSACLYFTTVLGPGSDPYHNDHLHFDVIKRKSGYRLCQ